MARTTVINTIERIRRQLSSALRYEVNVVGALLPVTGNVLSLSFNLTRGVRTGSVLSCGMELMRVMDVNEPTREVTVLRGWQDSDPVVHQIGEEVWINPRFNVTDIYEAMVDELNAWPPDLYRVLDASTSVGLGTTIYELPATFAGALGIVDVRAHSTISYEQGWYTSPSWPRVDFRLQRGTPVGFAPAPVSGLLLRFVDTLDAGGLYVQVAMPFNTAAMTYTADLVTDVGLAMSMLDVLTLGVKSRLMADTNHGRSQRGNADEPRRAEEVPPNNALADASATFQVYLRRRSEEMNRLRAAYPVRMT